MADTEDRATISGALAPGPYECVWTIDGAEHPGTVEIRHGRAPLGHVNASLGAVTTEPNGNTRASYPQYVSYEQVRGFIPSDHRHVVMVDAKGTVHHKYVRLRAALCLVGIEEIPPDTRFDSMKAQVTGLDSFAGFAPVTDHAVPRSDEDQLNWSARSERLAWDWALGSETARLGYDYRMALDPYRVSVRFEPWLRSESGDRPTAREWYDGWVRPLLHLTSAATGQAEAVTSVQFGGGPTRVIMYASPITQEPYYTRRPSDVPGFTVIRRDACRLPLIEALSKWRELNGAGHPLIIGFTPGALDPDQRPGSRVQTLLQWFEASYGYENRDRIEEQQEQHTASRTNFIESLEELLRIGHLSREQLKFAKRIPKKVLPGIAEAIRHYIEALPHVAEAARISTNTLVIEELDGNATSTPDAIRIIRNALAHGQREFDNTALDDLAGRLYTLVRGAYVALLGGEFDVDSVYD